MQALEAQIKKVAKLQDRRYINVGHMASLINMFPVPKGDSNIRLVFGSLYAPWFALPMVNALVQTVEAGSYCGDNDFGEMFYNYWLHDTLQELAGVDLTDFVQSEPRGKRRVAWEHFTRLTMGMGLSPYQGRAP